MGWEEESKKERKKILIYGSRIDLWDPEGYLFILFPRHFHFYNHHHANKLLPTGGILDTNNHSKQTSYRKSYSLVACGIGMIHKKSANSFPKNHFLFY